MIIRISHVTRYKYDKEVFLEPHTVRLRPKSNAAQRLVGFNMEVSPEPDGKADIVDLSGNDGASLWFTGTHDSLTIRTESVVETLRTNPFDYVVTDESVATLPAEYLDYRNTSLMLYRTRSSEPDGKIDSFVDSLIDEADDDTLRFLSVLNSRIYSGFEQVHRKEGAPFLPEVTLAARKGACRDLAVLFIEACRAVGLAARFVSGYRVTGETDGERELHAWAEVYLPGGGWRGYDPSEGLAVADSHVVVSSGASPADAAPVTGSYRGTKVSVAAEFEIDITS